MASEITEEEDETPPCVIDTEAQQQNIRQIIKYQKSLYYSSSSSSSFSSTGASCSSFSSPRKSSSLLDLMKKGSTSLRRLIDMEHTSLKTYLTDYSGSPIIKPILLWGSDTDDGSRDDPWMSIKEATSAMIHCESDGQSWLASEESYMKRNPMIKNELPKTGKRRLTRKRSFRRLPRLKLWIFAGWKFRLRLRRLRVIICGRKF